MPPPAGKQPPLPRTAVIGAGAAGLAMLKELRAIGAEAVCFEKGDRVGGLWAYGNSSGRSGAYESLHTNTSRARTEFEDFPMPAEYPDFPSHRLIAAWFDDFADAHGLRELIRFDSELERAERLADGRWRLTLDSGSSDEFDALVVASGHNWEPRWPEPGYPGEFDGEQMHSHDFLKAGPFAGKRVLVVGMGNSAMDIVVESSSVAEHTMLSTRKGSRVVPKYLFGRPADQITSPLAARLLPWRVRQPISQALLRLAVGRVESYGLPEPASGLLQDHPTISDSILSRITHGEIEPKGAIRALDGGRVLFEDGSAEEVDVIVWCTGYDVTLPFLDGVEQPDELLLYKRIFPAWPPNLFFVGLIQSTGSAIPLVEAQSKIVAAYLDGRYALPREKARQSELERNLRRSISRYGGRKRPAMRVDFDTFLYELRRELRRGERRAVRAGCPRPLQRISSAAPAEETVPA
jgi:dimethylaniline monooxygenase (N-oxide forming)